MMKRYLTMGLMLLLPLIARGQSPHTHSGFVVLRAASSTNLFYDCDLPTGNPDFTNTVAYIFEGETLFIGAEVKSDRYACNTGEGGSDVATLFYSLDGGATNTLNLPRIIAGSPDVWQEASATGMVEIGRTLAVGVHTISVSFVTVDINHCVAPGVSDRLPDAGFFVATFDVRAGPADVRACDDAGQSAYNGGWTNGVNGGYGFGPWTTLVQTTDGAAGGFIATNPANGDVNYIASRGQAWGLYANEAGGGGDDLQMAGAFRAFASPLSSGETFVIEFEHGGIQDSGVHTGWVGFALRSQLPPQQFDPDPLSAFGTLQNAQMMVGFRGGDANYKVFDLISSLGRDTGLPYTTNGVRAQVTMTSTDLFQLVLTSLGPSGSTVTVTGQTAGGSLAAFGVYDRNAEQSDAYFNKLAVLGPAETNRSARDNAADPAYSAGWSTNQNGGFGFNEWIGGVFPGAGSAGRFLATNPPNADLNAIASAGRAWGQYANDNPGGGVQSVTSYRYLTLGNMVPGQTFGLGFEHGGISGLNGNLEIMLLGNTRFGNVQGEVLNFSFQGGTSEYQWWDERAAAATGIPFTDGGARFDFKIFNTNPPCHYALTVETRGAGGAVYRFCGTVESAPKALRFTIRDVEQNDVFLNNLYLSGVPSGPDSDGDNMPDSWELQNGLSVGVNDAGGDNDVDGFANIEEYVAGTHPTNGASFFKASGFTVGSPAVVSVGSVTGRLYTLERSTNLAEGSWAAVGGQVDVTGSGAPLLLTNEAAGPEQFQRVRVRLAP